MQFPINLNLAGRRVLLVGGGRLALRKAGLLTRDSRKKKSKKYGLKKARKAPQYTKR